MTLPSRRINELFQKDKAKASTECDYEIKNLDHLGLVAAQFDSLGLVEIIDQMIPQDKEKKGFPLGKPSKRWSLMGSVFRITRFI